MDNEITVIQPESGDRELRPAQTETHYPPSSGHCVQHKEQELNNDHQELLERSEPVQQWVAAGSLNIFVLSF